MSLGSDQGLEFEGKDRPAVTGLKTISVPILDSACQSEASVRLRRDPCELLPENRIGRQVSFLVAGMAGGLAMKRKRFSEEQIIEILNQAAAGATAVDVCRPHGISETTFYRCAAGAVHPSVRCA
jgi:Transposase